ncbi:MAG: LptF/LptG family permease [Limnochordaceae bacterium]|nr:LptF/LptG family permease [Limnochordaceae bacterium]
MGPFLATAVGFVLLLITSTIFQLTDLLVVQRADPAVTFSLLALKVPAALSIALPIAALFGTLLSAGRLVRDGEMTVMRTAGLSVARIGLPVLLLGAAISVLTYALNEYVVPQANHRYEIMLRRAVLADPVPAISENVFFRGTPTHWFYVRRVDRSTRELLDALVYELRPNSFPVIYTARRGWYEGRTWHLEDVTMKRLDADGFVQVESSMKRYEMTLAEPTEAYLGSQKSAEEMSRRELGDEIRRLRKAGVVARSLWVEYHIKLSLPMAALVMTLLGLPLSLYGRRGGRAFGAAASLGLVLLYYVVFALFRSLGNSGAVEPLAAAWMPNLLYLAAAAWLFLRAEWAE